MQAVIGDSCASRSQTIRSSVILSQTHLAILSVTPILMFFGCRDNISSQEMVVLRKLVTIRDAIKSFAIYNEGDTPTSEDDCHSGVGFSWRYKIAIYLASTSHEQIFPSEGWQSADLSWWLNHPPDEFKEHEGVKTHVVAIRIDGGAFEPNVKLAELPNKQVLFVFASKISHPWLAPCDIAIEKFKTETHTIGDVLGEEVVACFADGTVATISPRAPILKFIKCCTIKSAGHRQSWDGLRSYCKILTRPGARQG